MMWWEQVLSTEQVVGGDEQRGHQQPNHAVVAAAGFRCTSVSTGYRVGRYATSRWDFGYVSRVHVTVVASTAKKQMRWWVAYR